MSDGQRYFLRTERLGFRCWTAADLPPAVAIWGQPEATHGVIRHAFGLLGIRGLFARHHPHNRGSGRILEKLGFRHTHDERMPQTGLDRPCYLLRPRKREEHAG